MKAVFKGIVTRTAILSNIAPDVNGQDSGAVQSAIIDPHSAISNAKVFSIKGLSEGRDLTDAQLARINAYAIVPLKKEEVHYVQLLMAHNGIDRDVERFSEELLADFARTLPGKGFFVEGHPGGWSGHGGPGEGLHFETRVVPMTLDRHDRFHGPYAADRHHGRYRGRTRDPEPEEQGQLGGGRDRAAPWV